MENTPNRIYLNLGEIDVLEVDSLDFKDLDGISWCEDKIDDNDLPYLSQTAITTVIKKAFIEAMETTEKRSQAEQNIIGNLLTVIECDLKKRIKEL